MMRVGVIGAGAAGLAVVRALTGPEVTGAAVKVVAWEQAPQVGGTWVFDPEPIEARQGTELITGSALYASLRTNLPKEVMAFDEMAFPDEAPSFMHHTEVGAYLESYADRFGLLEHVQTCTRVEDAVFDVEAGVWRVTTLKRESGEAESQIETEVDALVVATGHFSEPKWPTEVAWERFRGRVIHSHTYRSPEAWAGSRVLVLGAGPSGIDIARELATVAKTVILSHRRASEPGAGAQLADSVRLPGVIEAPVLRGFSDDGRAAAFDDGLVAEIDAVVVCTGYRYVFPFLRRSDRASSVTVIDEARVEPLYEHLWHTHLGEKLAFVGIPFKVIPFPLFEVQARWIAAVVAGRVTLPDPLARAEAAAAQDRKRAARGVHARYTHRLEEWDAYCARVAGVTGHEWSPHRKAIYDDVAAQRAADPEGYRDVEYSSWVTA
ncbi:flavin-containing monooxygenase FMO GS-OX3 [Thecamonas trahens ATCC 50062]|uniref:Flavin-containing monooxygenase FMO GS-OX3 n=1 Tax=Thecamonas trahens ATCC 50062 TaxID=461836 RepID=A0A0L0DQ16_THETB|nr:flavin-containing monooxygenase FMO GS-OX3 [Thecamonas trahens ATCC 50062]KNC54399.1 flavin-containing monooxygenase FMO GS-OX3 [Thecamonas trahens ATCC 50062]|eukprot:XP_013753697.1 flavin-containing monooxygenase FMO GS-OX3 [Thecamonas trahens ATCC 50062]